MNSAASSPPAIIYDTVRLFIGPVFRTPRGIDRVDFAYAIELFTHWPGEIHTLLPTPWGMRLFSRQQTLKGLAYLEGLWGERHQPGQDPAYAEILRRLDGIDQGPPPTGRRRRCAGFLRAAARVLAMPFKAGFSFGLPARARAPRNAIYLNISYLPYHAAFVRGLFRARPDIRPVYLVHDVIPLEFPDLVAPAGTRLARSMLAIVRDHAKALIYTTNAARQSIERELKPSQPVATITLPLPLPRVFDTAEPNIPALRNKPYFIICGAIDPRKNHQLLLEVWRELVRRHGTSAPRLVVAGSVAWHGSEIMRSLQQCGPLRSHIIVASGLSTPALRRLMAHAIALLLPSRAEGYGLPVIEALSLGTPVLLSDIPAFREIAAGHAGFLDPDDREGWIAAIERLAGPASEAARASLAGYHALREPAYFDQLGHFLRGLP